MYIVIVLYITKVIHKGKCCEIEVDGILDN